MESTHAAQDVGDAQVRLDLAGDRKHGEGPAERGPIEITVEVTKEQAVFIARYLGITLVTREPIYFT